MYRKQGINPRLIQIITGKSLEEIGESPPQGALPGIYAKMIRKAERLETPLPQNTYRLDCGFCGRGGEYNVGLIVLNFRNYAPGEKQEDALDAFQFTGYFRCKSCNGAGNWRFPKHSENMLKLSVTSVLLEGQLEGHLEEEDRRVVMGKLATYDGREFQWASEAESYFLDQLWETPDDGWVWNRLANIYFRGDRPDLAAVALEMSVKHDPGQVESHFSLGKMLAEAGDRDAAIFHLRRVLLGARDYRKMKAMSLRDMLTETLFTLLDAVDDPEAFAGLLPTADEFEVEAKKGRKHETLWLTEMELNFSTHAGMFPLAEVYMGKLQKQIPLRERASSLPPKKVKSKKKKKKKR